MASSSRGTGYAHRTAKFWRPQELRRQQEQVRNPEAQAIIFISEETFPYGLFKINESNTEDCFLDRQRTLQNTKGGQWVV